MKNHCFSFLEDSYADICNEAMFCEKHLVQKNYVDSILRAGKASEILTEYICEFENQDCLIISGQKNRLIKLFKNGTISSSLYDELNFIREIRNKAAHGTVRNLEDNARKVHFYLYRISTYFYKRYKDSSFIIEDYPGPIMKADSEYNGLKIGVLLVIILLLGVALYFQVNDNINQITPDLYSDNVDEHLFSFDDSSNFKTIDFNGLFRMDVNGSSTFHEVPPDDAWYVSKQWNNDVNETVYSFDGFHIVYYWKNTNLEEVVSNLSRIYHNPIYEDNIVILECYSHTYNNPAYYDYLVGTQSEDGEVVLVSGSDLNLLKTYANSIVFE